ncbi:hypothetical protein UlMin_023310 [Ulmus minor]
MVENATCKGSTKWKSSRKRVVSLEQYLHLMQFHNYSDLTVDNLNQIIRLHGYRKLHRIQKKIVMDAAITLPLEDVSRSTLNESISPSEPATLEDVIGDLSGLDWQECSITSIETLNSKNNSLVIYSAPPDQKVKAQPKALAIDYGNGAITQGSRPKKLKPKRKRSIPEIGGDYSVVDKSYTSLESC